jgi:hypothetical protein
MCTQLYILIYTYFYVHIYLHMFIGFYLYIIDANTKRETGKMAQLDNIYIYI